MKLHDRLMWQEGELVVVHPGDGPLLFSFKDLPQPGVSMTVEERVEATMSNKPVKQHTNSLTMDTSKVKLVKKGASMTADSNPDGINQYSGGGGGKSSKGGGPNKADKEAAMKVAHNMALRAHQASGKADSISSHTAAAKEHEKVASAYKSLGANKDAEAHEKMKAFHERVVGTKQLQQASAQPKETKESYAKKFRNNW